MEIEIEEILEVIRRQLGVRAAAAGDHLFEDLGAESLDVQSIISALEDKFQVLFEDDELERIQTPLDIHALLSSKL